MRHPLASLSIEAGWLLLFGAFAAASLFPAHGVIANHFLQHNFLLALLFASLFRFALYFRQIVWLGWLPLQIILFILIPIVFVISIGNMQNMVETFDTHDLRHFIVPGSDSTVYDMNNAYHFFKNEFVFFSVGFLTMLAMVEFRLALALFERIRRME